MNETMQQTTERIARAHDVETLETRKSDRLDFFELAVWNLRNMLEEAYKAGYDAAKAGREVNTAKSPKSK